MDMAISGISASYSTAYLYNTNSVTKEEQEEAAENVQPEASPVDEVATDEDVLATTEETEEEEDSQSTTLEYLQTIMAVADESTSSATSLAYTNDSQLVELKLATIEEQILFGDHHHGHRRPNLLGGADLFSAAASPTAAYVANAYKNAANNTKANDSQYQDDSAAKVDFSSLSA